MLKDVTADVRIGEVKKAFDTLATDLVLQCLHKMPKYSDYLKMDMPTRRSHIRMALRELALRANLLATNLVE